MVERWRSKLIWLLHLGFRAEPKWRYDERSGTKAGHSLRMRIKDSSPSELPEGFSYRSEFLSIQEEEELLRHFQHLEFHAFNFQGYIAKRRIIEYGFEYDFTSRRATAAQSIPEFLKPLQKRAAMWAGFGPQDIVEAVITEYTKGAPIGWHRDVPQFEMIIGISLNSKLSNALQTL
jgi:alkylated DNA repair dioxygenase AlkB